MRKIPFERTQGKFLISTDRARLDLDMIHGFLARDSYWAQGRSMETVRASIENALCFGVFENGRQVGFARVVTDFATFGWLCDVFVLPSHRGKGLSKQLVECVIAHPELQNLRRFMLATNDAHELYAKYGGFAPLKDPGRWMERHNPNAGV